MLMRDRQQKFERISEAFAFFKSHSEPNGDRWDSVSEKCSRIKSDSGTQVQDRSGANSQTVLDLDDRSCISEHEFLDGLSRLCGKQFAAKHVCSALSVAQSTSIFCFHRCHRLLSYLSSFEFASDLFSTVLTFREGSCSQFTMLLAQASCHRCSRDLVLRHFKAAQVVLFLR